MKFDIAFVDTVCAKPYTDETLEYEAIGGTEAATIRLAEGFASKGHKVCVIQKWDFMPMQSARGVNYLPYRWLDKVKPSYVIHLRARLHWDLFPFAKQFSWLHDACSLAHNNLSDWPEYTSKYRVQCIAVSDWHVANIKSIAPSLPVKRIYSPIDELCYSHDRPAQVDVNQLVWMSSPHKGLVSAIDVFTRIKLFSPKLRLIVFNPGYFKGERLEVPGVIYSPTCEREKMRRVVASSLCLFFPTQFEETFGAVAAEAEALGTPVATYKVAALAESTQASGFCDSANHLIERLLIWQAGCRPVVQGSPLFRFETIYPQWLEAFAGR